MNGMEIWLRVYYTTYADVPIEATNMDEALDKLRTGGVLDSLTEQAFNAQILDNLNELDVELIDCPQGYYEREAS